MARPTTVGASIAGSLHQEAQALAVPIGPRLERVLALAYRARRAVLLEGPTGIGKSEIVGRVAASLGIEVRILDLSLLEPPDLVGLPIVREGRTHYALPSVLPQDGAGILLLEELNRAERYIQQPALQLLSARRLHEYELPAGWVCMATINPQSSDYQVTALDRALRARFLQLRVRPDRAAWLAWAQTHGMHPGILALAQTHERILDDVPPRTWAYASDLLSVLSPEELQDGTLLRDALGGYLPPAWVELLVTSKTSWGSRLSIDVRDLLGRYAPDTEPARTIASYREGGRTDHLDEVVHRLASLLAGPEAGVLVAEQQIRLPAFEALLKDLPGDQREKLQEALGGNPTATALIDVLPQEVLQSYAGSPAEKKLAAWKNDPLLHHRVMLLVTALRAYVENPAHLPELKRSNTARACLGQLLVQLRERHAMPLVDTLRRTGVTPIRPSS